MTDTLVERRDLSEGELEEGEVLTSDEEGDQGESEGGENTQPPQSSEKTNGTSQDDEDSAVIGVKRPAPDSDAPNPKV